MVLNELKNVPQVPQVPLKNKQFKHTLKKNKCIMKIKNEKLYPTEMVLKAIEKEAYLTVGNAAAHFGLKRNAFYTRSDFKQIRELLDCNRATMIDYVDTLLWERVKSGNADVAMFVLFYKRYGDQEVRDSLRNTTILKSSTEDLIPLCDFE